MKTRAEIAGWMSNHFGSEALLFNLKLTYDPGDLQMSEDKCRSTYSQVKLHFNKAKRIAEDAKWGMPDEVKKIGDQFKDNEQSRYDVFMGYMRAALSAVAFNVSLAPRNRNERNVLIALNNTTAGILPYQFGDDYDHTRGLILTAPAIPDKVGGKKGKAAAAEYLTALGNYQKHVQELVKTAQSLWQQKLTFTYAGRDKEIREGLDSEDGYPFECTTGDKIYKRHMRDDEPAKFLGGLMRIFGAGQTEGPIAAETIVETATGKVEEERTTSQGTVVYEAERRKASMAEVLIAVARNSTNILVTAHLKKDCNTFGGFTGNLDGYRDYTAISFREDVLADPLKDWEDYYTCYDKNNDYSQNLWWVFSHELLHVYPIYESEYRELEEEEEVYHTRTKEEYEEWCRNNPPRPGYAWPSYEEIMRDPLKRSKLNILMNDPGSNEGGFPDFELRESPEEDVPSFVDEQALELNRKKEWKGKFADVDVEPSFTAYNLTDPAQVAWLRGWFEGRLEALGEHVQSLVNVTGADYIKQMESILEGILDELRDIKKLSPNLDLPSDEYDPVKVAEENVRTLIEEGIALKESVHHTYIFDNKKDYFPIWKAWLSIAQCFNLESVFKQTARRMMQDLVNWRKNNYISSEFAKEKINIQAWEREFGIKLTY